MDKDTLTNEIKIMEGLLQGDPLSPILFILFINDIETFFLEKGHHKVKQNMEILLFADDLAITANSRIDMQDKQNTLENYCKLNNLQLNIEKTKILVVREGGKMGKIKVQP